MGDRTRSTYETIAVARYPTGLEAEMAAAKLRANDIPAEAQTHVASDMLSHMQFALAPRGIAVLVPRALVEEAQRILSPVAELETEAYEPPREEASVETRARRAFWFALYALPVFALVSPAALTYLCFVTHQYCKQRHTLSEQVRLRTGRRLCFGFLAGLVGTAWAIYVIYLYFIYYRRLL
ncbi:MAG: hypothetical protein JXL80_08325 [Planctomycetes bacterium]|nr:hypothetical protein [Planctomycetota bacterium]